MTELTEAVIELGDVVERVRSARAGAVCSFVGTVRELTGERRTAAIEYEAYVPMAEAKLRELETQARQRWPILEAVIVHRLGRLEVGAASIAIAVSCPHRRDAFAACEWLIDTIKQVVPIWKKEIAPDGTEEWSHPGVAEA